MTTNTAATTSRGGVGFLGLLTIVLVVLKATGYLAWSWWLVFAPVWGPIAIILILASLFGAFMGVLKLLEIREHRQWRNNLRNNNGRK